MPRTIIWLAALLPVAAPAFPAPGPTAVLDESAPRDTAEGDSYNLIATYGAGRSDAVVALTFDRKDAQNGYLLRATAKSVELSKLVAGRAMGLAAGPGLAAPTGAPLVCTVVRRPGVIRAFAGPKLVVEAYDSTFAGGACGSAVGEHVAKLSDVQVQEIGRIDLEDDFFAGDERQGLWKMLVGAFRVDVYWDPKQKLDSRPIGASWYANEGPGDHLAVTGEDFWDDYSAEVSVLPDRDGTVGLAFRVHDAANYGALTLTPVGDGGVARLVEVTGGQERLLAEKRGPWPAGRWYRLRVEAAGRRAVASLNGVLVGEGGLNGWQWGRPGLEMKGNGACRFDDLAVRSLQRLAPLAAAQPAGPWSFTGGNWQAAAGKLTCRAASTAFAVAGAGNWGDCDVRATVALGPEAQAGLLARRTKAGGYALVVRPDKGQLLCSLRRMDGAGEAVPLAEGRTASAGSATDLRLVADGVALQGFVNGACVVKAWDAQFPSGEPGLMASGGQATFSGFSAAAPPARETVTALVEDGSGKTRPGAENSAFDRYLGDLWRPLSGRCELMRTEAGEPAFRLTGGAIQFYTLRPGDVRVSVDAIRTDEKALGLVLCAQPGVANSGYDFTVTGSQVVLTRQGTTVRSTTLGPDSTFPRRLSISRDGPFVIGQAGRTVVSFRDPDPLESGYAAVHAGGEGVLRNLALGANHALSYAFDRVEPDWTAASGAWDFHSGMACIPWAYWLTGDGRQQPALSWNRRLGAVDVAVAFDVSEYTEGYENDDHKHFPYHDVSVVLAAPQPGPDSGYRFVIGAEGGRLLRLYRNGQLVKESNDPRFAITMGEHCNSPRAIEVLASRHGGTLRLRLQGLDALAWDDPNPLGAGYIGLGVANCRANFRDLFLYRDGTWKLPLGATEFSPPGS